MFKKKNKKKIIFSNNNSTNHQPTSKELFAYKKDQKKDSSPVEIKKKARLLNAAEPKRRCKNWRHDRSGNERFPCRWPEIKKTIKTLV